MRLCTELEGFCGRVACAGSRVVGMGLGASFSRELWWCQRVADVLGPAHPVLEQAWVLAELAVTPRFRGRGVGGTLHDALLQACFGSSALLTTQRENSRARRFYERRGWTLLHQGFELVEGGPPFVVMKCPLLRQA